MSGMDNMEWREVKDGEWWLVFNDAPQTDNLTDDRGVQYPPSMTAQKVHDFACTHLYSWHNGEMPGESGTDPDYMHVCDLDDYIAELQALRDKVVEKYGRTSEAQGD